MTYSIVARDPATGELGVAVQTCMFGVGAMVPWARAGVGAVATQSITEVAYGPRCLDLLAAGSDAAGALDQARAADPLSFLRQVGVVDAAGNAAAFTGPMCIDFAGERTGAGYSVQANMMASDRVWPAMADAYEASDGALAHRLLAALRAAQREGGDARGQMSAAMVVVDGQRRDEPWAGIITDIRVDRSLVPLDDLARLLDASEAFSRFNHAVDALMGGNPQGALAELDPALQTLPGEANFEFLRVGALIASGHIDEGVAALRGLLGANPGWAIITRSFAAKGLIALPPGVDLDQLLS